MITPKFTVYSKNQKLALYIVDVVQGVIGLVLSTFVFIAMFTTQNLKDINVWTIIIGVSGIITLIDVIIRKAFNKQSLLHNLLIKSFKSQSLLFPQTPMQAEVCSWLSAKIQNGKGILIYGKANTGKTSSVFIYLSQHTKDKDLLQRLSWAESVIYIDCKNNKGDILDFFYYKGTYFRNSRFEKSLIIVDNLENMGKTFMETLLHTINSSTGTFILLADASKIDNDMYDSLEKKCMRDNCTLSFNVNAPYDFKEIYTKLTDNEKKVFLVIYYMSLSMTLIPLKDVFIIINENYPLSFFRLIIKSLSYKNLIKKFPFDHKYIILANRMNVTGNQSVFWTTPQNSEAILKILQNSVKFPESAWLGLIHLPYDQLIQQDAKERELLFNNALKCGNYITLYKSLQEELTYCPIKEMTFLYELGTLCFYNSIQEIAFEKYNKLIASKTSDEVKYATMLRIIEATHGDVNNLTKQNISEYINLLTSLNNRYALYAEYWMLHIESERGKFYVEKYMELLKKLTNMEAVNRGMDIHIELIRRCYTDIIRSSHILKRQPPKKLVSDFLDFMSKNYDKTMCQYYKALYVDANTLHYITLLDNILNRENCHVTYQKACDYYDTALINGMEKQKSVSACELKSIDLKLFNPENITQFEDYHEKIMHFLSNAEINKVSVHVAYCKTLLAKLYMIKNLQNTEYFSAPDKNANDSSIMTYIREAKEIYREYQNEYGVVRIEFIENLYHFVTLSNEEDIANSIQKMSDILDMHQEYQREIDILNFLKKGAESRMTVISIIKAYPIIMQ